MSTTFSLVLKTSLVALLVGRTTASSPASSPSPTTSTTLSPTPLQKVISSSFESYASDSDVSGDGVWQTGVSFNAFDVGSGSTPSTATGPSSAFHGSYYAYSEMSNGNAPGGEFDLQTVEYSIGIVSVSFEYMAYGDSIGTMYLQGSTDASTWTTLWSKSGNLGQAWYGALVTVPLDNYVRFYYVGGSSYKGDFALDFINITQAYHMPTPSPTMTQLPTMTPLPTPAPTSPAPTSSVPSLSPTSSAPSLSPTPKRESFTSSFENYVDDDDVSGDGLWRTGYSNLPWSVDDGSNFYNSNGPETAYDGSYYVYTETGATGNANGEYDLQTYEIPEGITRLEFYYLSYSSDPGTVFVEGTYDSVPDSNSWTELWSKTGNLGRTWFYASISMDYYTTVRFYYKNADSTYNNFGLDYVTITTQPAPTPSPTSSEPTPLPTVVCRPGTYLLAGSSCQDCPVGTYYPYSGGAGEEACLVCPYGRYAASVAAANCTFCPAGRFNHDLSTAASKHDSVDDCRLCATGQYSTPNRFSCDSCEAGQYVFNKTECVYCEAGRFAPVALTGECFECIAGSETGKPTGATTCTSCNAGSFSAGLVVNCSACMAGTYSLTNSPACYNCTAGFFTNTKGSSSCTACEAGRISETQGMTNCTACSMGRHQSASGQDTCKDCGVGTFAATVASSSCSSCDAGKASTSTGASSCTICPKGTYSTSGSSTCTNCSAGTFGTTEGASTCSSCSSGRAQHMEGRTACQDCRSGRSQSATGQAACDRCGPGKYTVSEGATACSECAAGSVQPNNESTACIDCMNGTFQSSTGQSKCDSCESGKHQNYAGGVGCDSCAEGTWSHVGSTSCDICDEGYFLHPTSSECTACLEGALCDRKGMTLESLWLESGWWRTSAQSENLLECKYGEACTGGNETDSYCKMGYNGPYCAVCTPEYYTYGQECLSCSEEIGTAIAISSVLICIIAAAVVGYVWRRRRVVQVAQMEALAAGRHRSQSYAFCQIVASLQGVFNIPYPDGFEYFVNSIVTCLSLEFLGDLVGFECVVESSFYDTLLVETLVPICIVLVIALIVPIRWFYTHRYMVSESIVQGSEAHEEYLRKHGQLKKHCFEAVLSISYLVVGIVSSDIFALFPCEEFDNGESRLKESYDLSCTSATHIGFAMFGGLMICVYPIGIPCFYFTVLFQRRKRLNPGYWRKQEEQDDLTEEDAIKERDEDPKNSKLMFLCGSYRPQFWWWEVAETLRRIAFTGALSVFTSGSFVQLFIGMWLCILAYSSYITFHPFISSNDARLAIAAQMQVYLILMTSIIMGASGASSGWISALLITTFIGVILVGVGMGLSNLYEGRAALKMTLGRRAKWLTNYAVQKPEPTVEIEESYHVELPPLPQLSLEEGQMEEKRLTHNPMRKGSVPGGQMEVKRMTVASGGQLTKQVDPKEKEKRMTVM